MVFMLSAVWLVMVDLAGWRSCGFARYAACIGCVNGHHVDILEMEDALGCITAEQALDPGACMRAGDDQRGLQAIGQRRDD